jgi:transcriptional regulator with XRE-family HTH domain
MSDIARKLKFLRERDNVTLARVATALGLEKEYLREVEAGRQEPTEQAIFLLAEFFKVKPEYFGAGGRDGEKPGSAVAAGTASGRSERRVRGGDESSRSGGRSGSMDFGDFTYFREEKKPAPAPRDPVDEEFARFSGEGSQVILKDQLPPDLIDALPEALAPRGDPGAVAKPPTARPKKEKVREEAPPLRPAAPPRPAATAARAPVAADAATLVRALVDVMVQKGFFTREEFDASLKRAEGA